MKLEESKTYKNLMTAFTGEVQAYAKYSYFADKAKKRGMNKLQKSLLIRQTMN